MALFFQVYTTKSTIYSIFIDIILNSTVLDNQYKGIKKLRDYFYNICNISVICMQCFCTKLHWQYLSLFSYKFYIFCCFGVPWSYLTTYIRNIFSVYIQNINAHYKKNESVRWWHFIFSVIILSWNILKCNSDSKVFHYVWFK